MARLDRHSLLSTLLVPKKDDPACGDPCGSPCICRTCTALGVWELGPVEGGPVAGGAGDGDVQEVLGEEHY